ncbi:hypothetical protein D3C84_1218500 [compost metagenome]
MDGILLCQQRQFAYCGRGNFESRHEFLVEDSWHRFAIKGRTRRNQEHVAFFENKLIRIDPVDALAVAD